MKFDYYFDIGVCVEDSYLQEVNRYDDYDNDGPMRYHNYGAYLSALWACGAYIRWIDDVGYDIADYSYAVDKGIVFC